MLVYEKIISDKPVLYATMKNVPAPGDSAAKVVAENGDDITESIKWTNVKGTPATTVLDDGKGGLKVVLVNERGETVTHNCKLTTAQDEVIIPYSAFVNASLGQEEAAQVGPASKQIAEEPAKPANVEETQSAGTAESEDQSE